MRKITNELIQKFKEYLIEEEKSSSTLEKYNRCLLYTSAGGAMRYLEEKGIGFDTGITKVPLVCASSIFDLGLGDKNVRPDFSMGYRACVNAEAGNYQNGSFGAGCGATVGKFLGPEFALKSGIGSFAVQLGTLKAVSYTHLFHKIGKRLTPN